jgi:hypothetical protein
MNLSKNMLRRLGRASPKKKHGSPSPAELLREDLPPSPLARAELARRAAETKEEAETATPRPEPPLAPPEAKAKPADARLANPRPPAPQTPPPESPWYEEMCRWRPRGAADPYDDDVEYYETIHRYDPLERALEEEDYDPDDD